MVSDRSASFGQRLLAAGILALGVLLAIATALLPNPSGYAQVGPRAFPALVAAGLIFTGVILLVQALRRGLPNMPASPGARLQWRAFMWVSGGLIVHMGLIAYIGFIAASTLLFAAVARAFGSTRPLRDVVIGAVLGTAVYALFTHVLGLGLPWGSWIPG